MKRESRTVDRSHQVDSPSQRHLPLVGLLVDARAELMAFAVASGLRVLHAMLEDDRTAVCGLRPAGRGAVLVGVTTRQYHRSLELVGADVPTRGTSKSAVSRRFVAKTTAQLTAWRSTALDLVGLLIDGVHIGEHCIVLALGIDRTGANTRSASGTAPPRIPPSVRVFWPISTVVASAPIAVS
jgi:hypothetical protein